MRLIFYCVRALFLFGAASVLVGCDSASSAPSVSSSTTEGTVSGTVTIKGKLATKGEVSFDPSNSSRRDVGARTAPIGPDGSYKVKTLIGGNVVRVSTPETNKDSVLQFNETTLDVQSGENKLDIVLTNP